MKENDVELIHRILDGDDTAFSSLVGKYQKQVHALAWRKIGDFHIAEEITQDTFLKAYQKLASLKKPHQFAGWLYVIATRCCQAWLRKKRLQTESLEELDSDELEPEAYSRYVAEQEAKATAETQRQVVKKLLATLPESERTVITLHYFGEMTCEKMSEFLGVSANTIKSRLRRARNRLKKEEPMIREAISNFQISPNLTENIMKEIARLKPGAPTGGKPLVPWAIAASSVVLIVLMLGIGSQYLARFQKPYSLDVQSEMTVELIDAPVVQNIEARLDVLNQPEGRSDTGGRDDGAGEKSNQALGDHGDYTRRNLPEGAKRKFGKGKVTDMQLSPDGTRLAITGPVGVWLYDVSEGDEIALQTGYKSKTEDAMSRVIFSPDGKKIVSSGYDHTIRIWDAKTGESLLTINMPIGPTRLFKFLTDGTWSIHTIPANQEVKLDKFLPAGKTGLIQIISDGSLRSVKFLHDNKTLMIQNLSGTIWFWDITTNKQIATYSPKLPEPKLEDYKNWLRMDKIPNPDKWNLATDAFVNAARGIDVTFAFAVGDKSGTISIRDGHTDREINTLIRQKPPTDKTNNELALPIRDRVNRPGRAGLIPTELPTDWVKWISRLKFSPDGKTLVSWSNYRMVDRLNNGWFSSQGPTELWDVATGKRLGVLPLFESRRSDVDVKFSEDGQTLAITGKGGCAIWDVTARREIAVYQGEMDVKFSGNGKTFALMENESFAIWDITTSTQIASIKTDQERFMLEPKRYSHTWEVPNYAAISWTGETIAAIDRFGTVDLWKPHSSTQLHTLTTSFTKPITTLAFAYNGKTLASGDGSGNIQLWDIDTGATRTEFTSDLTGFIGGLAFSIDNTTLTSESNGNIEVWNVTTGKQVNTYTVSGASDYSTEGVESQGTMSGHGVSFSWSHGVTALTPNGGKIAGLQRIFSQDRKIGVWDISTNKHLCTVTDVSLGTIVLAFTSDGKTFATREKDRVDLWNTYTGERLATFNVPNYPIKQGITPDIYAGVFTHDSKTLAVGGSNGDNSIFLWDIATQTHIVTLKGHESIICELVFSPDDTILVSGDAGGGIRLWEMLTGEHLVTFDSPGGHVNKLVFTPDGKTFASTNGHTSNVDQGGIIFLWDVPSK